MLAKPGYIATPGLVTDTGDDGMGGCGAESDGTGGAVGMRSGGAPYGDGDPGWDTAAGMGWVVRFDEGPLTGWTLLRDVRDSHEANREAARSKRA